MTIDAPAVTVVTPPSSANDTGSYVDWPAIIAGILLATAISVVLLVFGSAIGLSFTSFHARTGVAPWAVGIAAATWLLWVQVSSFMAGGYLTGRLRRRAFDATEHESDVRDGAHGLIVWAGAAVLGTTLVLGGVGSAANAVGSAANTVTQAASNVAGDAGLDPNAYFIDTLFRSTAPTASANPEAARAEAGRIVASAAVSGELPADDRTYLASVVAANTGLTQADAEARVDQTMANVEAAKAKAAEVAEAARKTSVLAAFLIAASFLISAAGAYWAAMTGGNHRDKNTVFADVFRRF